MARGGEKDWLPPVKDVAISGIGCMVGFQQCLNLYISSFNSETTRAEQYWDDKVANNRQQ